MTPFTPEEAQKAFDDWGANCGPTALAVVARCSLDWVHEALPQFDRRRYTNPNMMQRALDRLGVQWRETDQVWPQFGLARIQWEGEWTRPDADPKDRLRQTHWVACRQVGSLMGIFDVNALGNGSGWCSFEDWQTVIVPFILKSYPGSDGKWHITHSFEIDE